MIAQGVHGLNEKICELVESILPLLEANTFKEVKDFYLAFVRAQRVCQYFSCSSCPLNSDITLVSSNCFISISHFLLTQKHDLDISMLHEVSEDVLKKLCIYIQKRCVIGI